MSNWRNNLLWDEDEIPPGIPSGGFVPTNQGMQTPEDLVDDLTYSSYATNRDLGISSDGWKRMMNYGLNDVDVIQRNNAKVDAMERRYIRENTQNMSLNWSVPALKPPVNHRNLLMDLTTKKAFSWDEMKVWDFNELISTYCDALMDLNVFNGEELEFPLDNFPESIPHKEYMEFIISRGDARYYINNEGYDWARYMFEILNFPG